MKFVLCINKKKEFSTPPLNLTCLIKVKMSAETLRNRKIIISYLGCTFFDDFCGI